MKKAKIAIMGLGTVGGGAYDILINNRKHIADCYGVDIEVARILDRDVSTLTKRGISADLFASNIDVLANDKDIQVVVETMGGVKPAKEFIEKMLRSGKNVVTANKELIGKHWKDLEAAAIAGKSGLFFEASCVGGVPIVRTLTESLQGDNIQEIFGIINGTTNYILSAMTQEGLDYDSALKRAQSLGYAEANPTADVEGYDAAYKISILSSLAFHTMIPSECVYREGISRITANDIAYAEDLGYAVKLLAIARRNGNKVEARVHPAFVPKTHPLASVSGAYNAVYLKGDFVGDIMLYGAGAGAHPTGSAIVSDIVKALTSPPRYNDFETNGKLNGVELEGDFESEYYVAVRVEDRPGVLGKIAAIMGDNGISIRAAVQRPSVKDASVVFLTHTATEKAIMKSLQQIEKLASLIKIDNMIRVIK